MTPTVATLACALGILGLFALERDRRARTSPALWIPVIWLAIGGSRMVTEWLQIAPAVYPDRLLDGSPLDRNILLGLTVAGLLVLLWRRRAAGSLLGMNGAVVVFFLYCAASTVWSDYPFVAAKRWIKACGDLVMVLIVLTDPDRSAAIKRLFSRVGFLLIPSSILLIKYYPELGRGYDLMTGVPFVSGVTLGKNLLGMTCMIYGLAAAWRCLQALEGAEPGVRRIGSLAAQGIVLVMVAWLFWLADSMTSLACFLIALCVLVAATFRALRTPAVVHVCVASVLIVCTAVLFFDVGGTLLEAMGRDPTLTGRTQVWKVALRFAGDPLLGTGFESFWLGERLEKIWSIYWWHPNEAHNGYLEVFLNLGWIGVTLLVVLMATGYRNVLRSLQVDPDLGRFRLAYFVAIVAYNFTEAAIRTFQPIWVVFLLVTFAIPSAVARPCTKQR